jgi:hypothetical protein
MKTARRRGPLRLERMREPLAPWPVFRKRMIATATAAFGIILASLIAGMAGYHWFVGIEGLANCFYSASMIMGGMGPVGPDPATDGGKWFAGCYAIYSGVMLLASVGLLLSPPLHRILHKFHIAEEDEAGE